MNAVHNKTIWILIVSFTLCSNFKLFSNTIIVPDSVETIQLALNKANKGNTILVKAGTYYENIVWPKTASLKLLSIRGSKYTIIDGNKTGAVLTIYPSDES